MRIRERNGEKRASPWPMLETEDSEVAHQMQLYLAVMNRLTLSLGLILQPRASTRISSNAQESDDDFIQGTPESFQPKHWSVQILRGTESDAMEMLHDPIPLIEWAPKDGMAAPGHVSVRLQGLPSHDSRGKASGGPLTLVFDACFRAELG